ncbi:MAG: MFS transporter [Trueperaceae bacterium]
MGDLGASLTFVAINTWLLYYLVNVGGLRPFTAGLVFVIGRVVDAALDPVMGLLSDRLAPRLGRKRFVAAGAIPLGAAFAALWALPAARPDAAFALALGAVILVSVLYTVVQVPYMALTPELTQDYDERTALSSYRIAFGTFASLVAVALPPLLVLSASPGAELASSTPAGWTRMGLVFGPIVALSYLIMAATVPEPRRAARAPGRSPERPKPAAGVRASLRSAFQANGFAELLALFIAVTIGIMIVNSMLPFYLESALRIPGPQQTPLLGLLFGVAIAAFPLWSAVSNRYGKRAALAAGLVTMIAGLLPLVLLSPPGAIGPVLLAFTVVTGCGLSAVMLLPWAMLPDVVEFDELASGRRQEGLLYALFTFGQKLAGSVGVFANAIAAGVFGYVAGTAVQDPATVTGIRAMVGPVAAVVFAVALVLTLRFPITRASHREAQAALEGRRATG